MRLALSRLLTVVRATMTTIAVLMFVYMLLAVATQVIGRALFNVAIVGTTETSTMAQVWMVLAGAGLAMRNGQHVGVDVLVRMCPPRVRQIISIAAVILCLWFLGLVFVASLSLIEITSFQTASSTGLPMWVPYGALPVGAAYFALELAIAIWPSIMGREPPNDADLINVPGEGAL